MRLPGWSREEVHYIAERGYQLYRQGLFRDAGILFEGLLAIDPEDAYSRRALAAIDISLGRHELAVRHLSAIIARDRCDVSALMARCEALIAAGDVIAARRDLDSLAALPGGMAHARQLRLQFVQTSESAPSDPKAPQLLRDRSR
jgi:tetratricopeptide (TPR) repeat protein